MYTNQIRFTGTSGIDVESLVKQLMNAESQRLYKVQKNKTSLEWKQDAYRSISSSLINYQNKFMSVASSSSFRLPSSYKAISASAKLSTGGVLSDTSAITIRSGSSSKSGKHDVKVLEVASKDVYKSTDSLTTSIKGSGGFDYTKIKAGDAFNVSLDGETSRKITFTSDEVAGFTSESDFMSKFNTKLSVLGSESVGGVVQNKVVASVDGGNIKITSPGNHSVVISDAGREINAQTAGGVLADSLTALAGVPSEDGESETKPLTGEFIVKVGDEEKTVALDIQDTTDMSPEDVLKSVNAALSKASAGVSATLSDDGKLVFKNNNSAAEVSIYEASGDNTLSKLGASAMNISRGSALSEIGIKSGSSSAVNSSKTLDQVFDSSVFGADSKARFTINGTEFEIDKTDTIAQLTEMVNSKGTGATLSFDNIQGKFSLSSTETGAINEISFSDEGGTGLLTSGLKLNDKISSASDSAIEVDGVLFTRATNNFNLTDLSITITEDAKGKTFVADLAVDVSKPLDTIKSFVEQYNNLIDSLNKQTTTVRPRSDKYSYYDPLTDEEKKGMNESDLKAYEEKAKTGLLYNDQTVKSITSELRNLMYQPVTLEDGSKISLFEIGITTSSKISDFGKLVIDEDKLRSELEKRPDAVGALFTQATSSASEGLADRVNNVIRKTVERGGSLYNKSGIEGTSSDKDNAMFRMIKQQDDIIRQMRTILAGKETRYYAMFSKMETAMNQANSQMDSLFAMMTNGAQ